MHHDWIWKVVGDRDIIYMRDISGAWELIMAQLLFFPWRSYWGPPYEDIGQSQACKHNIRIISMTFMN